MSTSGKGVACRTARAIARLSLARNGEGELRHGGMGPPAGPVPRPSGYHQQQWSPGEAFHQRCEPGVRGHIDPVQVLHHQDQGLLLRHVQDQVPEERERPGLPHLRAEPCESLRRPWEVQELAHQDHHLLPDTAAFLQASTDGGGHGVARVPFCDPAELAQHVEQRAVRGHLAVRPTVPHTPGQRGGREAAAFGQEP
jgi:hypothetical protein